MTKKVKEQFKGSINPVAISLKDKQNRQVNQKWRGEITIDTTETQRIIRNYYEQLYAKKLDNLGKMHKFLEIHNLLKLNQEEAESLNRPITTSEIEAIIKKIGTQKPWAGQFHKRILPNI